MNTVLHNPQFQPWLAIFIAASLLSLFVVLWAAKKLREEAQEEEYEKYFKRLNESDKPNQKGL